MPVFYQLVHKTNSRGWERVVMATRVEKIYKTNTLIVFNNILNSVNDYVSSKKKIAESEKVLIKGITTELDSFFKKNNITDQELRKAVEKGN